MLSRMRTSQVATTTGVRTIVQLTASSPVLMSNAKARGFKSRVWVDVEDKYWYSKQNLAVRDGERPTEIMVPNRIELYNIDHVVAGADLLDKNADKNGHFSVKTKKRYSGSFAAALQKFNDEAKLDSKWWVSAGELRLKDKRLTQGAVPFHFIIDKPAKFYNAEQFNDPAKITMQPFSLASGKAYGQDTAEFLLAHATQYNRDTAVYVTQNQAETLGITFNVGAMPAEVSKRGRSQLIYPIIALQNWKAVLVDMQRFEVDVPTYVVSGKPIADKELAKVSAKQLPAGTPKYWISAYEAKSRTYSLVDNATQLAVNLADEVDGTWTCYNIDDATSPDHAAQQIGRYKRPVKSSE